MTLKIERRVLNRVFDHALQAYQRGEESCGVLCGPAQTSDLVDDIVPMENRANKLHALDPVAHPRTARTYFDIDPLKFAREIDSRRAANQPVRVLYHSHLDVGAYFSDTDAAAALGGGSAPSYPLLYLVTSVRQGAVDDCKMFRWEAETNAFVDTAFLIVEGPPEADSEEGRS